MSKKKKATSSSAASTKKKPAKKAPAKKKAAKKTAAKKAPAAKKKVAKKAVKKSARKPAPKKTAATAVAATTTPRPATAAPGDSPKVTVSPGYSGPPKKLGRDTYPAGAGPNDFRCYGPPATRDGDFENVRVCDMGCFTQDGKDSNKYYHGAVVQDQSTDNWYAYFEWGRTGAASPSFQFVACASEADARATFARQLHAKNDRRGEWVTIAGIQTLRAKKGKDCYLVRPMATRSTGLPDARSIKLNEGAKQAKKTVSKNKTRSPGADPQTLKLLHDLAVATIAYTRGSMADASLPTQAAIDEARSILTEAQSRLAKVGDDLKRQIKDKQLNQLTTLMYGRIPRKKPVGAPAESWVLSQDNILVWRNDLDAFESALYAEEIEHEETSKPLPACHCRSAPAVYRRRCRRRPGAA